MADYRHRLQSGFTLIEMMVVVAIMGIIAAIAYPSMQKQIAQMKVRNAANLMEMSLKQARSDALIYRSNVTITPTTTGLILTQTGNSSYPQTKTFDSKIKPLTTTTLIFSSTKTVTNAPASYDFCYDGVTTDKYSVVVDTISNVTVTRNGTCS